MSEREAMKITLMHLFEWLDEEKGMHYTKEQREQAVDAMHDDPQFWDELLDFFAEHVEDFGENYGL